ncbi:MAG: DUF4404 family protein [Acidimicrobiales bacterium]|nr:DUF4404 family protein [Acidimicrobiales bacterium]
MELRAQLEDLARRLHLLDDDRARALHADVQRSLEQDEHDDLGDRLTESAVHFETAHPELADLVRRVADALAASGL